MKHVHVIGAGLAGLSAALALVDAGRQVTVHEAGPAAGGRCRSYLDRELGCRIDNGNHLWLSGNRGIADFLARVGSQGTVVSSPTAEFPFVDLASGERWSLRPNGGRVPWWVLSRGRAIPGVRLRDYLAMLKLLRAGPDDTVGGVLGDGILVKRLMEPLAVSALNTSMATGSARLMGAVVRETLAKGGNACIPAFPQHGLSETFIDPAVSALRKAGAAVRLGCRVTQIETGGGQAASLLTSDGRIDLADSGVIMATPAPVTVQLLPGTTAPDLFELIVNVHYRTERAGPARFVAVVNGMAEWVFVKDEVVSVTISAANRFLSMPASDIAATVWPEVCSALEISEPLPPVRVLKEKRATFAATPAQDRLRPPIRTRFRNLALAGDWVATGLPATIEGAIRSGRDAAGILLAAA
jgi:squalene-associated FAD-dependent desaturase